MIRKKKYKNCPPEETIYKIKSIIKDKLNLDLKERNFIERNMLFHSCRLVINNEWISALNIGTNGKGMSESYSSASAHGELMERIQNGVLFNYIDFGTKYFINKQANTYPDYCNLITQQNVDLPFRYSHDEIYSEDNILLRESIQKYVQSYDNEKLYDLSKDKEHYYVPYFDVFGKTLVNLPIDIIFNNISTSGMCAGNTPEEALVQGLSEILERFVIRKIYFDNIAFPQIPHSSFEGTEILKRINVLEETEGFIINIMDCSCGMGIPAMGVLIKNKENTKYQFHIGVDPSPITALERCLTELFQGRTAILFKDFNLSYQTRLLTDIQIKEKEINETFVVSTGHYPISLFYPNPSYSFKGFDECWGNSDKSDLLLMTNLIRRLGYKIYIRDNSFLGFPAYSIYVPGMSELHNVISLRHFQNTYDKYQKNFICSHSLKNSDKEDVLSLLDSLYSNPDNQIALQFANTNDVWMSGNNHFLCGILYFRIGKLDLAINSINKAIERTSNISLKRFYQCFYDYMTLSDKYDNVNDLLSCIYEKDVIIAVSQCLLAEDWSTYFNLASCFNCNKCKIKNNCMYIPYLRIVKTLQNEAVKANLEQMDLMSLFKNE